MPRNRIVLVPWLVLLAIVLICPSLHAAGASKSSAKVRVDGVGWLRDRELRAALTRLLGAELKETLDANAIEDAAVILSSSLGAEGFQRPAVTIETILEDGSRRQFAFDPTFTNALPRPISAREVHFKIKPGVRYFIDTVEFTGL